MKEGRPREVEKLEIKIAKNSIDAQKKVKEDNKCGERICQAAARD